MDSFGPSRHPSWGDSYWQRPGLRRLPPGLARGPQVGRIGGISRFHRPNIGCSSCRWPSGHDIQIGDRSAAAPADRKKDHGISSPSAATCTLIAGAVPASARAAAGRRRRRSRTIAMAIWTSAPNRAAPRCAVGSPRPPTPLCGSYAEASSYEGTKSPSAVAT